MELLKVFNSNHQYVGIANRDEVHSKGYWHETFHCWIVLMNELEQSIYLQLRSEQKKDYAGLYDITAAGHLNAQEEPQDGVREIQEELGLSLDIETLYNLGVVPCQINTPQIIDNEFCHQFLYVVDKEPNFVLQQEEVAGMVKVNLHDFFELCINEQKSVKVNGFKDGKLGRQSICECVTRDHLVPHDANYFMEIAKLIKEKWQELAS